MPDIVWIILISLLMIIGVIGSVLPVLPGTPLTFAGLLIYKFIPPGQSLSWWWIALAAFLTVLSLIVGYFIPILTTKKYGGSKYGAIGATLGIFAGLFLPFGLIYGPFLGALIGELINDYTNQKKAIKASWGAFLGFLLGIGVNILICGIMITIFFVHLAFF